MVSFRVNLKLLVVSAATSCCLSTRSDNNITKSTAGWSQMPLDKVLRFFSSIDHILEPEQVRSLSSVSKNVQKSLEFIPLIWDLKHGPIPSFVSPFALKWATLNCNNVRKLSLGNQKRLKRVILSGPSDHMYRHFGTLGTLVLPGTLENLHLSHFPQLKSIRGPVGKPKITAGKKVIDGPFANDSDLDFRVFPKLKTIVLKDLCPDRHPETRAIHLPKTVEIVGLHFVNEHTVTLPIDALLNLKVLNFRCVSNLHTLNVLPTGENLLSRQGLLNLTPLENLERVSITTVSKAKSVGLPLSTKIFRVTWQTLMSLHLPSTLQEFHIGNVSVFHSLIVLENGKNCIENFPDLPSLKPINLEHFSFLETISIDSLDWLAGLKIPVSVKDLTIQSTPKLHIFNIPASIEVLKLRNLPDSLHIADRGEEGVQTLISRGKIDFTRFKKLHTFHLEGFAVETICLPESIRDVKISDRGRRFQYFDGSSDGSTLRLIRIPKSAEGLVNLDLFGYNPQPHVIYYSATSRHLLLSNHDFLKHI